MDAGSRIAVVNQHTNNYGDDAAGVALVERCLSDLDASTVDVFYIWDRGQGGLPLTDSRVRHHHVPILSGAVDSRRSLAASLALRFFLRGKPHKDLRQLVEVAQRADFVVVSPAGANIGIYKDWMYLFVLMTLVLSGIRPIFFQNTIGTSNSRIFNRVAKYVLKRSELFVREFASQKMLADEGLSAYLGVDTALLLNAPVVAEPQPYIAVVPTSLVGWHRDFKSDDDGSLWRADLAVGIAQVSAESGLGVRVIPHLYGPQAEPEELQRFLLALEAEGCEAQLASVNELADYVSELGQSKLVVSMRYHGLVLAALQGVPCVSLAYENKMKEAAGYLGQADLAMDIRSLTTKSLVDSMKLALAQRAEIQANTLSRIVDLTHIARGPLLSMRSSLMRRD